MDNRRKRLRYQANHRGIKECDLILGGFAELHLVTLSEELLDQFEALLEAPDQQLYSWIAGSEPTPTEYDNEIMSLIRDFDFPGKK